MNLNLYIFYIFIILIIIINLIECNFEGNLRLTGERTYESEGRVEVYHNDAWGTICDSSWDDDDCNFVCRYLGYRSGDAVLSAYYGQGSGDIWLSNVACEGDEADIDECSYTGYDNIPCPHARDAGCSCSDEYAVRLEGYSSTYRGRVEILFGNEDAQWGRICDESTWDDDDCKVVCSQVGYTSGEVLTYTTPAGSTDYVIGNVNCNGDEDSINECTYNEIDNDCTFSQASCYCSYSYDDDYYWDDDYESTVGLIVGLSVGLPFGLVFCILCLVSRSQRRNRRRAMRAAKAPLKAVKKATKKTTKYMNNRKEKNERNKIMKENQKRDAIQLRETKFRKNEFTQKIKSILKEATKISKSIKTANLSTLGERENWQRELKGIVTRLDFWEKSLIRCDLNISPHDFSENEEIKKIIVELTNHLSESAKQYGMPNLTPTPPPSYITNNNFNRNTINSFTSSDVYNTPIYTNYDNPNQLPIYQSNPMFAHAGDEEELPSYDDIFNEGDNEKTNDNNNNTSGGLLNLNNNNNNNNNKDKKNIDDSGLINLNK